MVVFMFILYNRSILIFFSKFAFQPLTLERGEKKLLGRDKKDQC
jgi:hypothetical protein